MNTLMLHLKNINYSGNVIYFFNCLDPLVTGISVISVGNGQTLVASSDTL